MKTKVEIKSIFGKVLFVLEKENNTLKETLIEAIKRGADLSGADLSGASLKHADLKHADLSYANLKHADLSGADLKHADLSGADLSGADLSGADLSYADLSYANLSGADLSGANLRGANLRGASLSGADLKHADLSYANLKHADLSGADNEETAILPIFCKWSYGIKGNLIVIGCKSKTIEEWDLWFNSNEEYSTSRGTDEFRQIEAVYNALKAYKQTLDK